MLCDKYWDFIPKNSFVDNISKIKINNCFIILPFFIFLDQNKSPHLVNFDLHETVLLHSPNRYLLIIRYLRNIKNKLILKAEHINGPDLLNL